MATNDVIVRLRAIGQAAFTSAMDEASRSVGKIGPAAEKSSKQTDAMGKSAGKAAPKWRSFAGSIAKFAGGAAAIYAAKRGITSSIDSTMGLAKSTLALQRATGLSTETASEWASVLKARDIDSKAFNVGLTKLSKTMVKAGSDSKTFASTFKQLGISQDTVRAGDVNSVLLQSADAFSKMTNPAEKAAMAQQLFGKQAQNLLPLMASGSAGIREQLGWASKYGAVLGKESGESAASFIKRQREMKIAMEGLKVSAGTALLPVITSLSSALLGLTQTLQPLLRNATLVKVTIALLTTAFIAYKVAVIASTIASMGMLAVWAAIPIAIIAIGAALIYAYKKVGWFRSAVNAVFNWIKTHWPLLVGILTGPFGLLVVLAIKNFDKLKSAFRDAWGAIKTVATGIAHTFSSMWNAVKSAAAAIPRFFLNLGKSIVHGVADGIKSAPGIILDAIKGMLPGGKFGSKVAGFLGLQHGGSLRSGVAFVGEAGPELLHVSRGVANVYPLTAPAAVPSIPAIAGAGGDGTIVVPVYLDGRVLTRVVASRTADRRARR
jgi:hypothetical protein